VVAALPFDVEDEGGAGGMELLASGGAVMVRRAEELLGLVGLRSAPARVREPVLGEAGPEGRAGEVWRALVARGEVRLEEVVREYGMSVGQAQGVMLELELGGWAVRVAGGAGWRVA
jgi:predicted Rossmann fold nucleotide-binding protein DprA/Smf involved in DNA uptake